MQIDFDTPFHPEFRLYTRNNAGEVFPEILTPLAWSLIGAGVEEGMQNSLCGDFNTFPRTPKGEFLVIGRFAGRLHLNLSVLRTVSERLPGTSAEAMDQQFYREADGSTGLPPHEKHPDDKKWARKALPRTLRTSVTIGRRVRRAAATVPSIAEEITQFLAGNPSPDKLWSKLTELAAGYPTWFGLHMTCRALTSAPLDMAERAFAKSGIDSTTALAIIANIPGLLSVQPSRELAAIAATVTPRSPLAKTLAERPTWDALSSSGVAGARELVDKLRDFLERYGHRGVNEFDPTYRAWLQDPDGVLVMLRALVGDGERPERARSSLGAEPVRLSAKQKLLVANARKAIFRAEISKDAVIRYTHQMRRVLYALAKPLASAVSMDQMMYLTTTELKAVMDGDGVPSALIERRAAEVADAKKVEPAVWSLGELAVLETKTTTETDVLSGMGGSAGTARGRVRLLSDPYGDFDDGDIIVTRVTDTAWTPLFLAAGAVVTDVGGRYSHATIVARELGIPAVVDTGNGTSVLRDGDIVEVDGNAGTVRVIEAAPARAAQA